MRCLQADGSSTGPLQAGSGGTQAQHAQHAGSAGGRGSAPGAAKRQVPVWFRAPTAAPPCSPPASTAAAGPSAGASPPSGPVIGCGSQEEPWELSPGSSPLALSWTPSPPPSPEPGAVPSSHPSPRPPPPPGPSCRDPHSWHCRGPGGTRGPRKPGAQQNHPALSPPSCSSPPSPSPRPRSPPGCPPPSPRRAAAQRRSLNQ